MRVLVFGMNDNPGGIESFLMNYIRRLQGDDMQFDFLCNTQIVAYEEELRAMGCGVTKITARSVNPKKYKEELEAFFKQNASSYQIIWVNICSLANIDYLKMAKKYGISRRIIHSHNSQNMDSKLRGMLHKMNRKKIDQYATDFWSCSQEAGEWFYSDAIRSGSKYHVIRNAIDVKKFTFSEENRSRLRTELGLEGKLVLGNVGRLHFQKNQKFLIQVFAEFKKLHENACLLLVGQGPDEAMLREEAKRLQVEEDVRFLGVRSDVPELLSAMDVFVFPSVFEGLSLVSLEVQASGIQMFATDTIIPEIAQISDKLTLVSLDETPERWAQRINEQCGRQSESEEKRENYIEIFRERGFLIDEEVKKLRQMLEQQ